MNLFAKPRFLIFAALLGGFFTAVAADDTPVALPDQQWSMDKDTIGKLPNGNHVASILEFLFQPAVLSNVDTGGLSRAENVQIAMLGESTRWQRWYFSGANITNPMKPGEPLIYLPLAALGSISAQKYQAANIEKNGIHLQPFAIAEAKNSANLSAPFQVGGPAFIPRAVADREPASDWGAPSNSRGAAAGSFEGNASYVFAKEGKAHGFLTADGYLSRRNFLSLNSPETAGEFTLISGLTPKWNQGDALHLTIQGRSRTHLGAEYYLPEAQTLRSNQYTALANYSFQSAHAEGALALGYAYRQTRLNSNTMARSLTDSLIQPPVIFPENSHTGFFDVSGFKKIPGEFAQIEYGINSRFEFFRRQEKTPGQLTENLFSAPYAATVYESDSAESNYMLRWQPFVRAIRKQARYEVSAGTNAHIDWGFTDAGTKIGYIQPAATLKGQSFIADSNFFVGGGVLHDTMGFTLQEVSFLNKDSLSGTRSQWSDSNNNGVAETSELSQGSRTGGKYHDASTRLEAPQKEELNLTFGYSGFKNWLLQLNFNGRIYRKLFEVRYADGTAPTFAANTAGVTVPVYDKTLGGNEIYELRNAEKDAYYVHAEITLAQTSPLNPWIFRGSVGGYYGAGYAPQGLSAFYNDPGVYNESTADPNFRETRFGRVDNDRGYIGKIIFGRVFAKVFTVSNVIRYRDGEPMAGYKVVTGLAQGPIAVPTEERAGGLSGIGRHTYSLAWDLRLRYDTVFSGNAAWAFLDVYNLLNSRTELAEYPLVGTAYRDPVEQGVQRTIRLGVGLNF